jgi:putative endonuclease
MPHYVYILANKTGSVLYTGVTRDLKRRIYEHKEKLIPGFTSRYSVDRLVYFEVSDEALPAFEREKAIKDGSRKRKLALINGMNPDWHDLYEEL